MWQCSGHAAGVKAQSWRVYVGLLVGHFRSRIVGPYGSLQLEGIDLLPSLTQPGHRQPMGLPQFSSGALPIFDVARQNAGHFPEHRDWQ